MNATATIQATSIEAIPAFFQALAQYAASHRRGQKALAEKDEMLTAHRIVKVSLQTGHAICTARVDMPEYHLEAGEQFQLFESSYSDEEGNSYAYIVGIDGCSCKGYEHRYSCCHSSEASRISVTRFHMRDQIASQVAPLVLGCEVAQDLEAHVADSLTDFASLADEIIEQERLREEQEAHLTERQRKSMAKYREETANMKRLQDMAAKRESAPLQPAGHVVEETEFGFIPMRQTA